MKLEPLAQAVDGDVDEINKECILPESPTKTFLGYPAPISNTTYTPNQFFDVVLPYSSRGCVRLVAYMLRRTLGWCDENGNPVEREISFSYSELQEKAGVSRDMIRSALDEAVAGRFIKCIHKLHGLMNFGPRF
ncbi:MAG: hypothetical protein IT291_09695 [Deltaproteobacteria bacterium]|nr:hypothetical protein [Deltaproteobacteria bacterium]